MNLFVDDRHYLKIKTRTERNRNQSPFVRVFLFPAKYREYAILASSINSLPRNFDHIILSSSFYRIGNTVDRMQICGNKISDFS